MIYDSNPFTTSIFLKSSVLCYLISLWHITQMPAIPSCTFAYFYYVCPPRVTKHLFKPSPSPAPKESTHRDPWVAMGTLLISPETEKTTKEHSASPKSFGALLLLPSPSHLRLFSAHLNNAGPAWPSSSPSLLVAWVEQRFP